MRSRLTPLALMVALLLPGTVLAQCVTFFNEADFKLYSETHGKISKGIEDFEEAVIDPGGKNCFPAPLAPGVPNKNFPNGLNEPNLIIQDNISTAPNAPNVMPSGNACALYVIGGGFIGSNDKKVGEDLFLAGIRASLDLIFTEPNHTGVGFKLSRFNGFPTGGWHITVYDKGNTPIGKFDVPAPGGTEPFKEFFGLWCTQTIGRINIADRAVDAAGNPVPAPDAIDDIQLYEERPGGCTFFLDELTFLNYNKGHAKLSKGEETFEEATITPGGKNCFPAPLGPFPSKNFPDGLTVRNLLIQDNISTTPNPPYPYPSGNPCALYVIGGGFIGSNDTKVGEDLFLQGIPASLDLILTEPNHTGVGFKLSRFNGFPTGGWHITVYDKGENPIGKFDVPAPGGNEPFKEFFGVWCPPTIGRVNIYDQAGAAPDAIDDIHLWMERPTAARPTTWGGLKVIYR